LPLWIRPRSQPRPAVDLEDSLRTTTHTTTGPIRLTVHGELGELDVHLDNAHDSATLTLHTLGSGELPARVERLVDLAASPISGDDFAITVPGGDHSGTTATISADTVTTITGFGDVEITQAPGGADHAPKPPVRLRIVARVPADSSVTARNITAALTTHPRPEHAHSLSITGSIRVDATGTTTQP
jgi:hypothetical protein